MTTVALNPGSHVGLVKPDERWRFPLGKLIDRDPNVEWRAYRLDDGRTIVLEAVEAATITGAPDDSTSTSIRRNS
ncbi:MULTISPECIES: hypothetical protein [unclassified Microbacterium]|uniref:hypothetical protein n=1 Tax=unclassified Microbacterium TaxID=2609290 RepID=UPI000EA885B5|nr:MULTISPECIES: hypothetical protein [unclassified Microbacterium]MBT2484764.1 hypothetical protein [Microbacterium sp. ISL-108]RKN67640.1 hypothetical protein D7252_08630 [Microbacterium sp. CGR2]